MKKKLHKSRKFSTTILAYLPLFFLSLLFFSAIWSIVANGTLYYCSDSLFIFDVIPSFVHGSGAGSDYYIAPKFVVYAIWLTGLAATVLLPVQIVKLILKQKDRAQYILMVWLVSIAFLGVFIPYLWKFLTYIKLI